MKAYVYRDWLAYLCQNPWNLIAMFSAVGTAQTMVVSKGLGISDLDSMSEVCMHSAYCTVGHVYTSTQNVTKMCEGSE